MLLAREMMKFWYTCHWHAVQANMESALSCDPSMMPLTTCLETRVHTQYGENVGRICITLVSVVLQCPLFCCGEWFVKCVVSFVVWVFYWQ